MNSESPLAVRFETALACALGAGVFAGLLVLGGVPPVASQWGTAVVAALLVALGVGRGLAWGPVETLASVFLGYALWRSRVSHPGVLEVGIWIQGFGIFLLARSLQGPGALRCAKAGLWLAGAAGVGCAIYQFWVRPSFLVNGAEQATQYLGRASGTFGNPNHFAAFLLLLLPLAWEAAANREEKPWVRSLLIGLAVSGAVALVLTQSRGAWLGALAGLGVLIAGRGGRAGKMLASGVVIAAVTGLVYALGSRFQNSVEAAGEPARRVLWKAAGSLWAEAPWFGHGGGSFAILFERVRPEGFNDAPGWAHSEVLNILVEQGALGLLLLAAVVLLWFRETRRGSFALAAVAAFAAASVVDFQLRIPGLVWAACLVAGLAPRKAPAGASPVSRLAGVAVAVVFGLGAFLAWPRFHSEALRRSAAGSGDPGQRRTLLEQAVAAAPGSARALADLSQTEALSVASAVSPENALILAQLSERHARAALAISDSVPEFWIRLGDSLELQRRPDEAGEAYAEALKRAPARADVWYRFAFHLGLRPQTRRLAKTAVEKCLQLDPGLAPAQALARELSSVD